MTFGKSQMAIVPGLSFKEALEYTTRGKKDAVITVGIIKDRQASWKVYGEKLMSGSESDSNSGLL